MRPVQGGTPQQGPWPATERMQEAGAMQPAQGFDEQLQAVSERAGAPADAEPRAEAGMAPAPAQASPLDRRHVRPEKKAGRDPQPGRTPPAATPAKQRCGNGPREQERDASTPADLPLASLLIAARLQPPQMLPPGSAPRIESPAPPAPQEMTPQDLRASLASAWMQPADAVGLGPEQWHFALAADAHTPLASLRLSGDAVNGWSLHVTAARGVAAQQLQDRGERLRGRLQARGQSVRELTIDDEEAGT